MTQIKLPPINPGRFSIGYNFASFSDDLTNYDDDGEGAFINMIGKF